MYCSMVIFRIMECNSCSSYSICIVCNELNRNSDFLSRTLGSRKLNPISICCHRILYISINCVIECTAVTAYKCCLIYRSCDYVWFKDSLSYSDSQCMIATCKDDMTSSWSTCKVVLLKECVCTLLNYSSCSRLFYN